MYKYTAGTTDVLHISMSPWQQDKGFQSYELVITKMSPNS